MLPELSVCDGSDCTWCGSRARVVEPYEDSPAAAPTGGPVEVDCEFEAPDRVEWPVGAEPAPPV